MMRASGSPTSTRPLLVVLMLLLAYTTCINGCAWRGRGYRNIWVELYSTTPCGDVGKPAIGVCTLSSSCTAMSGEVMGTYNCPVALGTCCRPVAHCDATSVALSLLWESLDYGSTTQITPSECSLNIVPSSDTCYIRVDFPDLDIQSTMVDRCGYSYFKIENQMQGDGQKICGTLNHKTTYVKVGTNLVGLPVPQRFSLVMDHIPHKYSVKFNHIKCSDIQPFRGRQHSFISSLPIRGGRSDSAPRTPTNKGKELEYLGRMFAVSYTREPLIRSCPVTFIAPDIVLGPASCALRLGGPGTSKGLMVVHGSLHKEPVSSYPRSVGSVAKYVATHGVVVKHSVFHPMYNHDTHEHDIAVYFLNRTVQTVTPVQLPVPIDDFLDLTVYLAHYRYYEVSNDITILNSPQEQITKVVSNSECLEASLPRVSAVTSNDTLCLSATPREEAPCNGEVGSPIVHIGGSGAITILGMLMGGYHHCEGKHSYPEPALKIINYLDFIDVATSPTFKIPPPISQATTGLAGWYNRILG